MIKRIRIQNYKSLRDVTVDLDAITVLVGRGGSGKSNFLDAIAYLRDLLLHTGNSHGRRAQTADIVCATARAAQPPSERRLPPPSIEFEIHFDVPGIEGAFDYFVGLDASQNFGGRLDFGREHLEHEGQPVFSREGAKWLHAPAMFPEPPIQAPTLEYASGIPEVALAYVVLSSGIGCYDFGSDVLMSQGNRDRQQRDAGLDDDAGNFLSCIEAVNRNLNNVSAQREITAALRKIKPTLVGLQVAPPDRNRVTVSLKSGERALVFDLSQESEGFRRFYAHLLALHQVPPKTLVTFEEPEKGLHPGAMAALADQIKALPMSTQGQVILTTHNPALLDYFEAEQIRVVEMQNHETQIGPVAKDQLTALKEGLATTGELLTVNPAQIDSVPAN